MLIVAAPLLQMERPDLILNWTLIGILLAIALILSVAVARRRVRERDDDLDN
jgi:membrane protein implicated in regulation of membrane protease activity